MIQTCILPHLLYYIVNPSCGSASNCDPRCSGGCNA